MLFTLISIGLGCATAYPISKVMERKRRRITYWSVGILGFFIITVVSMASASTLGLSPVGAPGASGAFFAIGLGVMGWAIGRGRSNTSLPEQVGLTSISDKASQISSVPIPAEDEEWEILSKYDMEVSAAVDVVRVHGEAAIEELWKAYRVINDKSQLSRIASQIDKQFRASIAEQNALEAERKIEDAPERKMKKLSISKVGDIFVYKGYKYDRLEDAVAYAEKADQNDQVDVPGFGLLAIFISFVTFLIVMLVIAAFATKYAIF